MSSKKDSCSPNVTHGCRRSNILARMFYESPAAILMMLVKNNLNRKQILILHENSGNGGCEKGGQGS
jgi:hypothetical protein